MARAPAGRPAGIRLSDHISLGVVTKVFPLDQVQRVLAETGKESERERDLPAHVMVYYVIALALYMTASTREVLRCLLEGVRWLWGAEAVKVVGKSGISQARTCLADRQFFGHALWREAAATGVDLLWRVKRNVRLPREARLADGSYLTTIYPGQKDRRHRTRGVRGRVVEYR